MFKKMFRGPSSVPPKKEPIKQQALGEQEVLTIDDFLKMPHIQLEEGHEARGAYLVGKRKDSDIIALFGSYLQMEFDEHFHKENSLYVLANKDEEITDINTILSEAFEAGKTSYTRDLQEFLTAPRSEGKKPAYKCDGWFEVMVHMPAEVLNKRDRKAYETWAADVSKNILKENNFTEMINTASPGPKSAHYKQGDTVMDVQFRTSLLKGNFTYNGEWSIDCKLYPDRFGEEVGIAIYATFRFYFIVEAETVTEWKNSSTDFGVVLFKLADKNYNLHWEPTSTSSIGVFSLLALRAVKEAPSDVREPLNLMYVLVPLSKEFPHPITSTPTDIDGLVSVDKLSGPLLRYLRAHDVQLSEDTEILYCRPYFLDNSMDDRNRPYL